MADNSNLCYLINNHELRILQKEDLVIVEIDDSNSGQFFRAEIPDKELPTLTKDLVKNGKKLGDIVSLAMDDSKPNTKLQLVHQGSQNPVIKITKKFADDEGDEATISFDVELEQENLDKLQILERNYEKLSSKFNALQKRTDELERSAKSKDTIKDNVKLNTFTNVSPTFDPNGTNKAIFTFGTDNKSITKTGDANPAWYVQFAQAPLNSQGKYKFSVKILKCPTTPGHIMIGVASKNLIANQYNNGSNESFFLYIQGTSVYLNATNFQANNITLASEGDIVTVYIDLDQNEIIFQIEEYIVYRRRVDLSALKTVGLYPCVELYDVNDSVTFL